MRFFRWVKRVFTRKRRPVELVRFKPILIKGKQVDFRIDRLSGFNATQKRTMMECFHLACKIMNSVEFKVLVTNSTVQLEHLNGMDKVSAYNLIMSGKDLYDKEADGVVEIEQFGYKSFRNVIGKTYMGSRPTHINTKYVGSDTYSKSIVVGNIIHEVIGHNCGFTHESSGYSRKNLPYFYGDQAQYLAINYLRWDKPLTPLEINSPS